MLLNVRVIISWGEGCYGKKTYKIVTVIGKLKFKVPYFNYNNCNNENNNNSLKPNVFAPV